jgi:hypothetical protein
MMDFVAGRLLRPFRVPGVEQFFGIMFFMQSWLDEQIAARDDLKRRESLKDSHAPKLYSALWDELMKIVAEAKEKGFVLNSHGSETARGIDVGYANVNPRKMSFSLSQDKRTIEASGGAVSVRLTVSICDDGVVCLKHNGEAVSIEEAARRIMKPVLFPELQRPVTP